MLLRRSLARLRQNKLRLARPQQVQAFADLLLLNLRALFQLAVALLARGEVLLQRGIVPFQPLDLTMLLDQRRDSLRAAKYGEPVSGCQNNNHKNCYSAKCSHG